MAPVRGRNTKLEILGRPLIISYTEPDIISSSSARFAELETYCLIKYSFLQPRIGVLFSACCQTKPNVLREIGGATHGLRSTGHVSKLKQTHWLLEGERDRGRRPLLYQKSE